MYNALRNLGRANRAPFCSLSELQELLEQPNGIDMGESGQERPLVASPSKLRVDAPSFSPVVLLALRFWIQIVTYNSLPILMISSEALHLVNFPCLHLRIDYGVGSMASSTGFRRSMPTNGVCLCRAQGKPYHQCRPISQSCITSSMRVRH